MAKKGQNRLYFLIKVGLIGASLNLLLSYQSWAKDCTPTKIQANIEQFKNKTKKDKALKDARDAVVDCGEGAVELLEEALNNPDYPAIRANAALTLGKMGIIAQDAVPALVKALGDSNETVRSHAASSLSQIGRAVQAQPDSLFEWNLGAIKDLEVLKQSLEDALKRLKEDKREWASKEKEIDALRLVSGGLETKLNRLTDKWLYQVAQWVKDNSWVWLLFGYLVVYLGVFIVRPTWLLKLDELVKPVEFKIPLVNLPVSLRYLLFLKYHPRVLDAWVKNKLGGADQVFQNKSTVREREIHIPVPVTLDGETISKLSGQDLQPTFQEKRVCLLISGEGGAGKTSLACQIAQWGMAKSKEQRICKKHRMLPVLIEQELESQDLTEAIRGQLQDLINAVKPISEELLDNLLRQRRLLVIVDHLSEMSEVTRQNIQPNSAKFPVNALIVTSRLEEKLGGVNKTILKPLRVEGDRLHPFMNAYLEKQGKLHLFNDEVFEFYRRRLSRMVGERKITVLLARMYTDQLISAQEGTVRDNLPENIPELMLSYLNKLNRTVEKPNQRNKLSVHRDAQVVAWECLKQTYQPGRAMREEVVAALAARFNEIEDTEARKKDAESRLQYLEKRLRLIQTVEPGDKIRFVLDPLAEYLGALCLVDDCRDSEEKWNEFLTSVDAIQVSLDAIQGFLLAVRDCCLVKQKDLKIPEEVPEKLGEKAKLDREAIEKEQRKRRVWRLIEDLDAPEKKFRSRAVVDVGAMGKDATKAIPRLYRVLENGSEVVEIRLEALRSLKQLRADDSFLRYLGIVLENESEVVEIRLEALRSLKQLGADERLLPVLGRIWENGSEVVEIRLEALRSLKQLRADDSFLRYLGIVLENESEVVEIRLEALRSLKQLGADERFLPVLGRLPIVEIKTVWSIRLIEPPHTAKIDLGNGVPLEMVAIPGGTFMMGASEGEGYESEYPQHEVKVQPFFMGKYPVTQAQWREIATLPKVKRDLKPDPSRFKGDDRPVEQVSWYDVVEFCQRLSKQTVQEYRLPSEAEWEYSCRAGTTTPFHFGETITTDLANYRGTDWKDKKNRHFQGSYGSGPKGEYRKETAPVGSFPPNAFGLYDMHGNVWEWCADTWHDNYQGAPTDGSAWTEGGKENRSLYRGGSWSSDPKGCRSACRLIGTRVSHGSPIGFRVVCVAPRTT